VLLYYAIGGGLGHLCRARKVIEALAESQYQVVTAAPEMAAHIFSPDHVVAVPTHWSDQPDLIMSLLKKTIAQEGVNHLLIDTFPNGVVGELDIERLQRLCRCSLVARYLDWDTYKVKLRHDNQFYKIFVVDQLSAMQRHYYHTVTANICNLSLTQCVAVDSVTGPPLPSGVTPGEYWLVAHSAPESEVRELVAYAREVAFLEGLTPQFLISTTVAIDFEEADCTVVHYFPVSVLFGDAKRIVTAAGFNLMLETLPYAQKHIFLPFPRKYDDQFMRARERKALLCRSI